MVLNSEHEPVLTTTGHENNTAHVTVNLNNPFSAGLTITKISSSVASHGLSLGTINQSLTFVADSKKTTSSPQLDFDMNLDPASIFTLTRALAVDAGLDTAQLDGIVQLGGIQYLTATSADNPPQRRANIFTCVALSCTPLNGR